MLRPLLALPLGVASKRSPSRLLASSFPLFLVDRNFAPFLNALPIRSRTRTTQAVQRLRNIRPHNRNPTREPGNGREKVAEQDQDAVQLDQEAEERPAHEYKRDAEGKSGCAFPFLPAREEG